MVKTTRINYEHLKPHMLNTQSELFDSNTTIPEKVFIFILPAQKWHSKYKQYAGLPWFTTAHLTTFWSYDGLKRSDLHPSSKLNQSHDSCGKHNHKLGTWPAIHIFNIAGTWLCFAIFLASLWQLGKSHSLNDPVICLTTVMEMVVKLGGVTWCLT